MPLCLHRLCLLEANGYLCSHFAQVYGSIRIELKGIFGEKGAFIYVFSPFALVRRQRRSQDLFPGLVVGREKGFSLPTHKPGKRFWERGW